MFHAADARRLHAAATMLTLVWAAFACATSRDESADADSPRRQSEQPPPPSEDPLITTDRDSYQLRRTSSALEVDIIATFTNRTSDTVYLHPCGRSQPAFALEKWVESAWRPAFNQACPAILMLDPPRIAPGASRTDTARVEASLSPDVSPRFEIEPVAGTYRLVYVQAYGSWQPGQGPGELLPLGQRVSGPFEIRE